MELNACLDRDGEWLKGAGPASSIAISTRVRLARNLANRRFSTHAAPADGGEVLEEIRAAISSTSYGGAFTWFELDGRPTLDRLFLMERHLISRELAEGSGPRAVAFDEAESTSVMVNEEDHLRLQALRSGLRLQEAFEQVNALDDELAKSLEYAFDPAYGYLTSCPTNVGTGLRVSVMLHLPALVMTKFIEKVFRAVYEMRMAVRGFYGEGTEAFGELYQISNQITCGRSEAEIIDDMQAVIESIVKYEEKSRIRLITKDKNRLEDRIWRSLGALQSARLMSSEEAMKHISSLRLGVVMGIVKEPDIKALHRMFLFSQPAHLQLMAGRNLAAAEDRDAARAAYLRQGFAAKGGLN